ncbi:MAG TPA: hypothetical protein VGM34_01400 [Chlamydiales bacterium]|jgi:hypothetical protein
MKKQALNKWVFVGAAMVVALACYPKKPQTPTPAPTPPTEESSKNGAPSIPAQAPAVVESAPASEAPAIVQESVPAAPAIVQQEAPAAAPAILAPQADESATTPSLEVKS